jgi:hypothetical protein
MREASSNGHNNSTARRVSMKVQWHCEEGQSWEGSLKSHSLVWRRKSQQVGVKEQDGKDKLPDYNSRNEPSCDCSSWCWHIIECSQCDSFISFLSPAHWLVSIHTTVDLRIDDSESEFLSINSPRPNSMFRYKTLWRLPLYVYLSTSYNYHVKC